MSIVDRIKLKVNEKGLSIKAFEKEIGLGNGTIRRWNDNSPQCDKISIVANYLHVSLDWLVLGKEPGELTPEEQQLLDAYRSAAPTMQEAAKKLLDVPPVALGKSLISENGEKAI